MYYYRYKNHLIRDLIIAGNEDGVSHLKVYTDELFDGFIKNGYKENREVFDEVIKQLDEYFNGKRDTFDIKLNPKGTEFQKKVWSALINIPFAETRTYKEIATDVGNSKASRAVGMANNKNPIMILIPCHRVIGSNGKLVGYAGGLSMKESLLNIEALYRVFYDLLEEYGKQNWWPADTDYEMMIGAILTQNTAWTNVEKAIVNLKNYFGGNISPESVLIMDNEELAKLIKPSGYYNQKAEKIKELTRWLEKYNYNIEDIKLLDGEYLRKEVLDIKGVGKETADCILTYALNKPYFVIDAYTRRVFARLGYEVPKEYDDFRAIFQKNLHDSIYLFGEYHGLIVRHCKDHCLKKPKCEGCPLEYNCKKQGI